MLYALITTLKLLVYRSCKILCRKHYTASVDSTRRADVNQTERDRTLLHDKIANIPDNLNNIKIGFFAALEVTWPMEELQKSEQPSFSFLTEAHSQSPELCLAVRLHGLCTALENGVTWVKTLREATQPSCLGPCNAHPYNATVQISLKCSETLLIVSKSPIKTLHRLLLTKQPSPNINKNLVLYIMLWQNFHWLQLLGRTQTIIMTNNKCRNSQARSSHAYLMECS